MEQRDPSDGAGATARSKVPARLDRLPWSSFHTKLVIALGASWVLDGIEITLASAIGPQLESSVTLGLTAAQVGLAASIYLFGEVIGALVFGRLSDRFGRKRLFLITLGLYLLASGLTALSFNLISFLILRFFAGAGIGGEYAAINSAIDELIPARDRGRVDLAVNGTYWLGAIIGSLGSSLMLNPDLFGADLGWRLAFLVGPIIALCILPLRRSLPESPRWLLTHGRVAEAERTVDSIEATITAKGVELPPVPDSAVVTVPINRRVLYRDVARTMLHTYPRRTAVGMVLGVSQSFLYNAIFFSYTLILTHFYGVPIDVAPRYLFIFAAGNLLGPLLLGRFFDTIGRRPMICATYATSGVILFITGWLFKEGELTAATQTALWSVVFFIASAAASSAYLTVSEVFPAGMRAETIAVFFAVCSWSVGSPRRSSSAP